VCRLSGVVGLHLHESPRLHGCGQSGLALRHSLPMRLGSTRAQSVGPNADLPEAGAWDGDGNGAEGLLRVGKAIEVRFAVVENGDELVSLVQAKGGAVVVVFAQIFEFEGGTSGMGTWEGWSR
jgi:hypothetical protein